MTTSQEVGGGNGNDYENDERREQKKPKVSPNGDFEKKVDFGKCFFWGNFPKFFKRGNLNPSLKS
jgi:hypothetical protein